MRFSRSCFGKTFAMTQMWCREPEGLFVGQKQAVVLMYIYRSELFPSRSGWPDGYIVQYLYQYCHLKIWDMIGRFSGYFNLLGKEDNLTFGYIYIYIITNVNVYILYADKYMDIGTWMSWLFQQRQVTATQVPVRAGRIDQWQPGCELNRNQSGPVHERFTIVAEPPVTVIRLGVSPHNRSFSPPTSFCPPAPPPPCSLQTAASSARQPSGGDFSLASAIINLFWAHIAAWAVCS